MPRKARRGHGLFNAIRTRAIINSLNFLSERKMGECFPLLQMWRDIYVTKFCKRASNGGKKYETNAYIKASEALNEEFIVLVYKKIKAMCGTS